MTFEAVDQSTLQIVAGIDIVRPNFDESIESIFIREPNNQTLFNRLPLFQFSAGSEETIKPVFQADAKLRLHVNSNADHILGFVEQVSPTVQWSTRAS